MKTFFLTLLMVLATVAICQFVQRRSHESALAALRSQLDAQAGEHHFKTNPTILPDRTSRSNRSSEKQGAPKPQTSEIRKLAFPEMMSRFGGTLGSSTRRLMELRDQLPEDERIPFADIFEVLGRLHELKISDPNLATELIQEADIVMRSMIDTMTNMKPEDAMKLSKGDIGPNQNHFGLGYIASALDLGEAKREELAAVLAETDPPEDLLKTHLSDAEYRLLIELTKGKRYDELSEEEREAPLDLLGEVDSFF